jgi:hypothetical protein
MESGPTITMKNDNRGPSIAQEQFEQLMSKAMEQPGVQTVMDVLQRSGQYDTAVANYEHYVCQGHFAPVFSSCDTTFRV